MQNAHDLAHEFPDMKDAIHALKTRDAHFRRLFDEYEEIIHELQRVDDGAGDLIGLARAPSTMNRPNTSRSNALR